jgi:hypothetical protein
MLPEVVALEARARLPTRPNKRKPPAAQMHAIRSIIGLLSEVIREPDLRDACCTGRAFVTIRQTPYLEDGANVEIRGRWLAPLG